MAKAETTGRPGRGLRIALAVSVALNLAVAGMVAGQIMRGPPDRPSSSQSRDLAMPFTRALSREDQRALRKDLLQELRARSGDRSGPAQAYRDTLGLLRADPFDAAAVEAVMAGQASRAQERLVLGQEVFAKRLRAMSKDERHAYADRLEKQLEGFEKRTRDWHRKRD